MYSSRACRIRVLAATQKISVTYALRCLVFIVVNLDSHNPIQHTKNVYFKLFFLAIFPSNQMK